MAASDTPKSPDETPQEAPMPVDPPARPSPTEAPQSSDPVPEPAPPEMPDGQIPDEDTEFDPFDEGNFPV